MREQTINKTRWLMILMAVVMGLAMLLPLTTHADAQRATIDWQAKGVLYIDYKDDVEGVDPIVGAEFTAYKIADIGSNGEYLSVIESLGEIINPDARAADMAEEIQEAYRTAAPEGGRSYTFTTGANGTAVSAGMELGLYLVVETAPAPKHFATIPFFVSLPYTENNEWVYSRTAEPKPLPAGDLKITKTVVAKQKKNNKDMKKEDFHFVISFENYEDDVMYKKSNGNTGVLKGGQGTITLKHGEEALIIDIPVGTAYTVTETEAGADGCKTTIDGGTGHIRRTEVVQANFINRFSEDVITGDSYIAVISFAIFVMAAIIGMAIARKKSTV